MNDPKRQQTTLVAWLTYPPVTAFAVHDAVSSTLKRSCGGWSPLSLSTPSHVKCSARMRSATGRGAACLLTYLGAFLPPIPSRNHVAFPTWSIKHRWWSKEEEEATTAIGKGRCKKVWGEIRGSVDGIAAAGASPLKQLTPFLRFCTWSSSHATGVERNRIVLLFLKTHLTHNYINVL